MLRTIRWQLRVVFLILRYYPEYIISGRYNSDMWSWVYHKKLRKHATNKHKVNLFLLRTILINGFVQDDDILICQLYRDFGDSLFKNTAVRNEYLPRIEKHCEIAKGHLRMEEDMRDLQKLQGDETGDLEQIFDRMESGMRDLEKLDP